MRVAVRGCAVCAPGLPDWGSASRVLAGDAEYDASVVRDPAPVALPANERRRLPQTARMALAIGLEALDAAGLGTNDVATVFTSCGSDGEITHRICEELTRTPPEVSPTRFHNSVHNAAGGYWSIALRTHAPSTSLCAFDGSFAAGLLEAAAQAVTESRPVLLIGYDLPYPAPLSSLWNVAQPFCAALLLAPVAGGEYQVLDIDLAGEWLEPDWPACLPAELRTNPTAAVLPVFELVARGTRGRAVLPLHADNAVVVVLVDE